ncbi:MAG: MFS transporter [SAR324 cluster bacterium]|nr:MFS transporter [SAR324 cluster bacterium]
MQSTVDYSHKWHVLTAVAISIYASTISSSIVNVALPTLVRELDSTFPAIQWVMLAYLLTQATLMPIIGRIGDMIGRKTIFIGGFVIFAIGSVLCGFSPNVYWLIGFRIVQAIGGAMTATLGFAIIVDAFPDNERGKALGLNSTFSSTGIVLGPVIGGFLLEFLPWQWLFFSTVPLSLLGLVVGIRYVPEITPSGGQRFDYSGAVTLFLCLLSLLLALTLGQRFGFQTWWIVGLFLLSLVFVITFVIIEWHFAFPMIELRLFQSGPFAVNLITRLVSFVTIGGTILLLPFYLEEILGYETRQAGLLLVVIPICMGILSPISGTIADRLGARPMMITGVALLVLGYFSLSSLDGQTTTLGYIVRLLPVGIGMGIFQAPNNSILMGAASKSQLGVVSGLVSITRTLGQTIGVAVIGTIWAGRTLFHHGTNLADGVTAAPLESQIFGLQDTFVVVSGLVFLTLLLNLVSLRRTQ